MPVADDETVNVALPSPDCNDVIVGAGGGVATGEDGLLPDPCAPPPPPPPHPVNISVRINVVERLNCRGRLRRERSDGTREVTLRNSRLISRDASVETPFGTVVQVIQKFCEEFDKIRSAFGETVRFLLHGASPPF